MAENILFRTEIGRLLTKSEVDDNFRYVANPWVDTRVYKTGMIIYHDIDPNEYILYRAKQTTTKGSFILSEWDKLNNSFINVIESAYNNITDYINNEWVLGTISVGDYLVLSDNSVYLLYDNDGDSVSDYIQLNSGDSNINIIHSSYSTINDYIINEWDGSINLGDILVLSNNSVYLLTSGDGSSASDYVLISSANIIWNDIVGKPSSTPSQIDNAVSKSHSQNTDLYLDFGGGNQISALELYSHVNDSNIHFDISNLITDHTGLTSIGSYTHSQIDTHIDDNDIHFTEASINHSNIDNSGLISHSAIDNHILGAAYSHSEIDSHLDGNIYEHAQIDAHINDVTIHFTEGDIDHSNILNSGSNTHAQIDSHISNSTIHYLQTEINHNNLINSGTNSHAQIDSHISNSDIHYLMGDIDHAQISNNGTNTHAQIDSHISNSDIHYLQTEINHSNLINSGTNSHIDIDNHISNANIHFQVNQINHNSILNVGLNTHAQIDSHISNSNIHFTQASIDHNIISNIGTYSHIQIDSHINDINSHFAMGDIDHTVILNTGIYTHNQIDTHINDSSIHLLPGTIIDHANLANIGSNSHVQIDNHILDSSIHFTEGNINHLNILNAGSYNHSQIDGHINDSSIHFAEGDIDHQNLINSGFYLHYEIDNHIQDNSIHYLMGDIDHNSISNVGSYSHIEIDNHLNDSDIHFSLNDILSLIPLENGAGLNSVQMLNSNSAYGDESFVMGYGNYISGLGSSILSGTGNNVDGNHSAILSGLDNIISSNSESTVIVSGSDNEISPSIQNTSILSGTNITADLSNYSYLNNLKIVRGRIVSNSTDILTWSGQSIGSSLVEIYLDKPSSNSVYSLDSSQSVLFKLDIIGYNSTDNVSKTWEIRGAIKSDASNNVSLVGGSLSSFTISEDGLYDLNYNTSNWEVSVSANNSNQSLRIQVKGEVLKTIDWEVFGLLTKVS